MGTKEHSPKALIWWSLYDDFYVCLFFSHFSRSHCKMLQLLEISLAPLIEVGIHHTSHFLTGFMALPRGQTKSLAKSGLLEKGPWKLNVMIAICSARQEKVVGSHLNAEHSWTVRSGLDPLLQRLVPIL